MIAGLLAILALGTGPVSSASAAACDTSWATGDGDWTKVANWTNGLPGVNGPNVCITAPGTYTVHVTARNGDFNNSIANAPNLILGGHSGQQTVAVDHAFDRDRRRRSGQRLLAPGGERQRDTRRNA